MSSSVGKQEQLLLFAAVKQAQLYAMAAVAADEKQDYATALANYRQVINILSHSQPDATQEDQPAFTSRISVYARRIELIESLNPSLRLYDSSATSADGSVIAGGASSSSSSLLAVANECFHEEVIPDDPYACEELVDPSSATRVFWLMRLLLKSFGGGAFVAPRVFVSRAVWSQTGVRLDAASSKLGACYPVLEGLQQLSENSDPFTAIPDLERYAETLSTIQNALAHEISWIQKVPKYDEKALKQARAVLQRGVQQMATVDGDTTRDFIAALQTILKEALFLEEWYKQVALASSLKQPQQTPQQVANTKQAMLLLTSVTAFFNDVLCPLVVKDLSTLVERYLSHNLSLLSVMS